MSSKRRVKRRACQTKKAYETEAHARSDARAVQGKDPGAAALITVYLCPWSGQSRHWHIGRGSAQAQQFINMRRRAG